MAINKKLIHFQTLANFNAQLSAGNILDTSIVFIKDAKKIWTHGQLYDCSGGGGDTKSSAYAMEFTIAQLIDPDSTISPINIANLTEAVSRGDVIVVPLGGEYNGYVNAVGVDINPNGLTYIHVYIPSELGLDYNTAISISFDSDGNLDETIWVSNLDTHSLKTINGQSILGRGNITIQGGSGGGSAAYPIVNHGTSDTTFTLTPNTFHVWGEVSSLDLSFGAEQAGVANEFLFQFASGATSTSLTLPDDIKWANDTPPTIAENMIYQVSILNGMASVLEFDNEPEVTTISFKIRNYECIAEEGMTWEQWVSSEYNTIGCAFMGNNIHHMGEIVGTSDTTYVTKTDAIISDFVYTLIYTT